MSLWSCWLISPQGKMGSLVLLLMGILSTPGLGLTSLQRPHCAGHESSLTHAVQPTSEDAGHHGSQPSWNRPSHSDCTHCPPSDCASLAPCSVSGISVAVPTLTSIRGLSSHRVGAVRIKTSPHSTHQR